MQLKPWEKRLSDLSHILQSCAHTYFEPDLFRRNTNQFLQTARTVTFIIQKNKATIRDFDRWYGGIISGDVPPFYVPLAIGRSER